MFYAEHQVQRGYKSTMESIEHFGLGKITTLDSVIVEWQSGKRGIMKNLAANQLVTLEEKNASPAEASKGALGG